MPTLFEEISNISSVEEQEELFKELVTVALAKKASSFEFIKNRLEWQVARESKRGLKKVIKLFNNLSKAAFKTYCGQVQDGSADFNLLYAYTQYQSCEQFYKEELAMVIDMQDEYRSYLASGHFLEQFVFNYQRDPDDLFDFRGDRGDN